MMQAMQPTTVVRMTQRFFSSSRADLDSTRRSLLASRGMQNTCPSDLGNSFRCAMSDLLRSLVPFAGQADPVAYRRHLPSFPGWPIYEGFLYPVLIDPRCGLRTLCTWATVESSPEMGMSLSEAYSSLVNDEEIGDSPYWIFCDTTRLWRKEFALFRVDVGGEHASLLQPWEAIILLRAYPELLQKDKMVTVFPDDPAQAVCLERMREKIILSVVSSDQAVGHAMIPAKCTVA